MEAGPGRRRGLLPEASQRLSGKWRASLQSGHVDDRRGQVPQTDRLFDDLLRGATPGRNNHERDVQLGFVETRTVAENAGVLTETLAMIRRDDQPGSSQDPAPVQLVDQHPELLIEIRDAIVIRVGGKCHASGESVFLSRSHQCSIRKRWELSVGSTPKR